MQTHGIGADGFDSTAAAPAVEASTLRRVIVASSIGTLFEWYDFYLYGSLAVFFGKKFFPEGNETAQLLASLATFGAGFGVRPLGALVFGHIGDLIGRSEEHTSELQSQSNLVCRLLLEKKKKKNVILIIT